MDVTCTGSGRETTEFAIRRVRFALRRVAWLAPRTKVVLAPHAEPLARCDLSVETLAGPTVRVTALDTDWRSAIDNAVARAARLVVRALRGVAGPRPAGAQARAGGRRQGRAVAARRSA